MHLPPRNLESDTDMPVGGSGPMRLVALAATAKYSFPETSVQKSGGVSKGVFSLGDDLGE